MLARYTIAISSLSSPIEPHRTLSATTQEAKDKASIKTITTPRAYVQTGKSPGSSVAWGGPNTPRETSASKPRYSITIEEMIPSAMEN